MIADDMSELVKLFETSDLNELSIEQQGRKLFLRKGDAPAAPPPQDELPRQPVEIAIKAQLVGTFFWNKEKSGKPGLALHQHVEKGQLIGYIEALDILNEVESPESGEVVEISVAGRQPVEYGQTLVTLGPVS